jgi:hypothetical protein
MVDAQGGDSFCTACRHNRTIPDLSLPENRANWQKAEEAKRRLFYSLIKLRLPIPTVKDDDDEPLVFDFLAEPPDHPSVVTGHDHGEITIALKEADDATREAARVSMGRHTARCWAISGMRWAITTGTVWCATGDRWRGFARFSAMKGWITGMR